MHASTKIYYALSSYKVKTSSVSESAKKPKQAVSFKPGSLLARRGGMVTTVRLGKKASTRAL